MQSKTDQLKAAWAAGDKIGALRIASRFWDRSPETKTMKRGWDAHQNPDFYRQLGRNPDGIVDEAITVMVRKFGL